MTSQSLESRTWTASLIFDAEDAYARSRRVLGRHPRPIGRLRFYAVAEVLAGGPSFFPEPLELVVRQNPSGYHLFFGEVRLKDSTRRHLLTTGRYLFRLESDFYQSEEHAETLPKPDTPLFFDLQPAPAYPFSQVESLRVPNDPQFNCSAASLRRGRGPTLLRGTLHRTDGTPFQGATVEVAGVSNPYVTDSAGQWVLWFDDSLATGPQTVRFLLTPGAAPVNVPGVCIVQGFQTTLRETALRGWVFDAHGVGIEGAAIQVSGQATPSASRRDGSWSYYFDLNQPPATVDVTALLPGGPSRPETGVSVVPRSTGVVPAFRFN